MTEIPTWLWDGVKWALGACVLGLGSTVGFLMTAVWSHAGKLAEHSQRLDGHDRALEQGDKRFERVEDKIDRILELLADERR